MTCIDLHVARQYKRGSAAVTSIVPGWGLVYNLLRRGIGFRFKKILHISLFCSFSSSRSNQASL